VYTQASSVKQYIVFSTGILTNIFSNIVLNGTPLQQVSTTVLPVMLYYVVTD